MKLCKECKHFVPFREGFLWLKINGELSQCAHPKLASPVTAGTVAFCSNERLIGECGTNATLFESK